MWVIDALTSPPFRRGDYLIIGGGGLLYHREPIDHMTKLTELMKLAGGRVDILGLGCEEVSPDRHDVVRKLMDLADRVTVRSTMSAEILSGITSKGVQVEPDFAFNLSERILVKGRYHDDTIPRIGLVTGGDYLDDLGPLCALIQRYTMESAVNRVKFIHIPHSRAFVDPRNNDVIVGHVLWSSIYIYYKDREMYFVNEPFSSDPMKLCDIYANLDGVMSSRFHGLVFARLFDLPTLALSGDTLKIKSFIRDYSSDSLFVCSRKKDLDQEFKSFIRSVRDKMKRHSP